VSDLKGYRELLARLEALGEAQPVLKAMQIDTVRGAKENVHRISGHLGQSIVPGRVSATSATVEARTPYAAAEELGRRPVTIRPKNARVLAWGGPRRLSGRLKSGGKATHFASVVHQPARKGHPYLIPAAKEAVKRVREAVVKAWNEAA